MRRVIHPGEFAAVFSQSKKERSTKMMGNQSYNSGVRVDVHYSSDTDTFEICYQEYGQPEPTVLKMSRGCEQYLCMALAAINDCSFSMEDWNFSVKQEERSEV
jgi:hypothetical protein